MTNDKYKGMYRIPSARWQNWDYGANAAYYVTICTAHREHYFGEIVGGEMQWSVIGQVAHEYWQQIPAHFPYVTLDTFVIMPNHVHGIIVIDAPESISAPPVETLHATSLQTQMQSISPKSHSLSAIVRSYKSAVTNRARQIHADFAWQSRFYDRVIRGYAEFARIAEYIDPNITNWTDDDELYEK